MQLLSAALGDLEHVASWLSSEGDVRLWAGPRVSFPVNLVSLPQQIQWDNSQSWSVVESGTLVAFGQVIQKPLQRLHLARLIVSPERRRKGCGHFLAASLLEAALVRQPSAVSLNVAPENLAALNLYRSLGFVETSRSADEAHGTSMYMQYAAQAAVPPERWAHTQ